MFFFKLWGSEIFLNFPKNTPGLKKTCQKDTKKLFSNFLLGNFGQHFETFHFGS